MKLLHVLESSYVHHQESSTVHTANLYDIPLLCVQRKTPDDGQRNCPKRVEFHPNNKFEKSVLFWALRPDAGHGLLSLDVSRSHTKTNHSQ